MLINSSSDDGDILISGKPKKMFNRRGLFKKLHDKVHRTMRESLRARILSYPNISVSTLRWFVISSNRLTPISELRLVNVEQASMQRNMIVDGERISAFPNKATLAFNGSAVLLEASPTSVPNYFGSGEIGRNRFTRTYAQHSNERDVIMAKATFDLALMKNWLARQDPAIAWFNAWLERAVDRAITYYVEHIALWRQEGKVDEDRRNATIKPIPKTANNPSTNAA